MHSRPAGKKKQLNLALQGGGAHGAFTWGVLDYLLEHDSIEIGQISGTSAGAMNAVALADGLVEGGPEKARETLARFWRGVSKSSSVNPFQRSQLDVWMGNWSLEHSPAYTAWDLASRVWSPYQLNPLGYNPLRELVAELIDFDRVACCSKLALHIAATNVRSGKIKIFTGEEVTLDATMASCCLPYVFQAVEIGDEAYWDGGYMGNPPLFPLFHSGGITDILLVQINPVARDEVPRTASEISERLNEITFNSTLLRELRAIDFVSRLLDDGILDRKNYTRVHMHRIEATSKLITFGASSKLNPQWEFLEQLFEIGRDAAQDWVARHLQHIGDVSTLDLAAEFQ
ncbi:patatin-like phospholipase family protein [Polycladidibacter hongkongensis]|uniref:patatin-like phospholipase family protein n=1 Tax=Polycladidibacter hongkongensis TaxID=1647556 RepID=UPI00082A38A3|nr:patatin-like phospholipase family protein [Pseudovibrio hongkongensis]